jgi:hypothetical protein
MSSVGIGEYHLQGGPVLFFERVHNSTAAWGRGLRRVRNGEAQHYLKG